MSMYHKFFWHFSIQTEEFLNMLWINEPEISACCWVEEMTVNVATNFIHGKTRAYSGYAFIGL